MAQRPKRGGAARLRPRGDRSLRVEPPGQGEGGDVAGQVCEGDDQGLFPAGGVCVVGEGLWQGWRDVLPEVPADLCGKLSPSKPPAIRMRISDPPPCPTC
jgi:hypothetical protein